ncbi:MAG: leucine-rich repeat domain-containing protein, partial [Clostridia bacterium]|nr:leucine-rich repeat domain-containing protein [Clostridia bacterium]
KMKKVLAILLTLCMVMGMMPVGVIAADEPAAQTVTEDTADLLWEYETYGDGVALTAYLGSSTDVYVPSKIEVNGSSYAVIKLGDSLFEDNDALNSVTLGDGITEIGARAFYDADNLVTIVTDEQLTAIGTEAFYSCDSFNSVILYDTVTSIGEDAFAECPNLTVWCNEGTAGYTYAVENSIPYEILNPDATPETYVQDGITYYIMNGEAIAIDFDESTTEVTVPATVEGYPVTELRETFRNCHDLVSVVLPDDLKKIGERTFYECYSLENVNIPYGIDRIDNYTFYS